MKYALIIMLLACSCRYNGNQFVTVNGHQPNEKGLAPIGDGLAASGAINIIQSGNDNSQSAGKDLLKAAANTAVQGSGVQQTKGNASQQPTDSNQTEAGDQSNKPE